MPLPLKIYKIVKTYSLGGLAWGLALSCGMAHGGRRINSHSVEKHISQCTGSYYFQLAHWLTSSPPPPSITNAPTPLLISESEPMQQLLFCKRFADIYWNWLKAFRQTSPGKIYVFLLIDMKRIKYKYMSQDAHLENIYVFWQLNWK